jgi:hypothetical protein
MDINVLTKSAKLVLFFIEIVIFCNIPFMEDVMAKMTSNPPLSSATTYALTQEDIIALTKLVEENGDSNAAFRLYQYYNFSQYNKEKIKFFLDIAARNGNVVAQNNLSSVYLNENDLDKAYKWAIAAKNNGGEYSDWILKEVQKRRKEGFRFKAR